MSGQTSLTVTFGEGDTVVVRLSSASRPIVARALAVDRDERGEACRILLDRAVHKGDERWDGEWRARGAFVSMLERLDRPH